MTVLAPPLALDPLIAEAKQRARRRRLLLAGLVLVAAVAIAATVVVESRGRGGGTRSGVAPPVPRAVVSSFGRSDFKGGGRLIWATNNRSRVWFTTNDGRTWRLTPFPGIRDGTFIGADFIDPTHGWGVADDRNIRVEIARTTDGGRTWRSSYLHGSFAWGFHFRTPTRGYVDIAEPEVDMRYVTKRYATRDGGATWTPVSHLSKLLRRRHALKFVSSVPQEGGSTLTLVRTDDHGRHWTRVPLPGSPNIKAFKSFGHLRVVLGFVQRDSTRLAVYVSEDDGVHWALRLAPRWLNPGGQSDACCFNVSTPVAGAWYAIGGKGLSVTHDAGRTWHLIPTSGLEFRGMDFAPIDFVDARVGWVLGGAGLLRTTDGGRHWVPAGPRLPKKHKRG
jgi:photosystem II stability/assembly factor-like uncharacterized protein